MASPQNLGRVCGFLTEGKRFFSWLAAEGSLTTELFERAKWRRVTLDGSRSFVLMYPFFGVCGSVLLEDVAFLWTSDDPLGLRGRARFFYTRPCFKRSLDLREANDAHNADRGLLQRLVQRFLRVHRAHSPDVLPAEKFELVKGYPFRVYTLADEAKHLFDETFDFHVAKQKEHYLRERSLAKLHGKKKTSNLRYALQVHLREQARLGRGGDKWLQLLSPEALHFANHYPGLPAFRMEISDPAGS